MKEKILRTILVLGLTGTSSISFADTMADAVFNDQNQINENITEQPTNNVLTTQVYIQKTYYSINDVVNTLNLYNIKSSIIQQGNSSQTGYKITNTSNLQNFLNEICPKLGYSYTLNQNNIVVFKSIVPIQKPIVIPAPTIAPKPAPTKVDTVGLLPVAVVAKVESKPIESKTVASPYKPKIVTEQQKYNGLWVMSVNDKTIKKTFEKWAKQSGWTIIWDSNYDFPIRSGMEVEGDLDFAINEVCRASTATSVQMLATIAKKNKTIVITTPNI